MATKQENIKDEEKLKAKAEAAEEDAKKEDTNSNKIKLKVLIDFTDKYTDEEYKVNDEKLFEEERAKELLQDKRRLVIKID